MTIAREYFQRVLSPWVPGVDNPIPALIDKLAREEGVAVDVGCGPGVLVCLLAQRFGRVIAIDRDPEMIDAAGELVQAVREQGAAFGEIELRCADWAECDDLRGADLVCAVNSILETDAVRRARMIELLGRALRDDGEGTFLGVFPSMEAQVHLLRLYADALAGRGVAPADVRGAIEAEFLGAHRFDALEGTFSSRDEPAQRFTYELELEWSLADAGLVIDEVRAIHYPWEVCRQVDAGYFPGEVELHDWFVKAHPR